MNSTAKKAGQSAGDLARKIAKQMAQEPLEIAKNVGTQIAGTETQKPQENLTQSQTTENNASSLQEMNSAQDKIKSGRRMEALEQEIKDIHRQELFGDLQSRISQGEEIPLTDYSELSMEQKQVLKAQMEAVKYQKQQTEYMESQSGGSLFGSAKKGRKMRGGQKGEAEKQQTRVEKPVPPSG